MTFPKIDVCIVCEAVRPELYNKQILLGYFGIAPYAQIFIQNFDQPLTVSFVFSAGLGANGKYKLGLRLTDPTGAVITDPTSSPPIENSSFVPDKPINVFLGFHGVATQPGTYKVELLVNDIPHFSSTIGLQQAQKSGAPIVPLFN